MTREEFETWITEHRQDLVNIAVAVVGARDAEDAVQDMVASWLTSGKYLRCRLDKNPLAWATTDVRCYARNRRRGRSRKDVFGDHLQYLSAGPISGVRKSPRPSLSQMDGIEPTGT